MKKILVFLLILLSLFGVKTTQVLAQEKITPEMGLSYTTKRLKEKITLFFKFSNESKAKYYEELLDKRLAELKYVIEDKQVTFLETSSQRYETTAGQLTEFIKRKKLVNKKDSVIKKFEEHQKTVEKIRDNFPFQTAEWRFVMNDFNSLQIYKDELLKL